MAQAICLFFLYWFSFLLRGRMVMSDSGADHSRSIGAIVDLGTRSGREESVAMRLAIEDFRDDPALGGYALKFHARDSQRDPIQAASAAMALINEQKVDALIGLRTWQEAAFVAELGQRAHVPILSFTSARPPSASERWPFLVQVGRNQRSQLRAIAAIIQSWKWRRVTIIYEDIDYTATSILPHLADALRDVGSEIDHRLAIAPSVTSLSERLEVLRGRQCRVFIVHTSLPLAARLFSEANQMGMMDDGYVWITTDEITNLLDSVNSSTLASMQGVIGVKNYFHPGGVPLSNFNVRFQRMFHSEYPQEESTEPQFSALQAYDMVRAVTMAIGRTIPTGKSLNNGTDSEVAMPNSEDLIPILVSENGPSVLDGILQSNFVGLSGEFHFVDGEFAPPKVFQIVNVVGKSYREVGFWSNVSGFSKNIINKEGYGKSMEILGQVFWPGGPWTVPLGWAPPASQNPLKIVVPAKVVFPDFVRVEYVNDGEPSFEGFSIDVFKAAVEHLRYHLPYEFVSYNGTYDSLVEIDQMKITLLHLLPEKSYDVLVGDTSISSGRYHYVEFSQPYTPSGLVMVVPARIEGTNKNWIFLKPFTASMWVLIATIGIYNGIVVWLLERRFNGEFRGSFWDQVGTMFWVSFTTPLFPGEKLHSNLSRMAMVVWLFAAVVLTTNYTAILSSMLTAQRINANLLTVDLLKNSNAMVGCNNGSVVGKYLVDVLGFRPTNVRKFSMEDDYPEALLGGHIKAAFLRISHANLLLAKYCKKFVRTGPVYHVGGLGFVLPRGSPLLTDISQAILEVFENGTIQKLENAMLASYNCSDNVPDATDDRLSPESFWGLFVPTVFASTVALMLYGMFLHRDNWGGKEFSPRSLASKSSGRTEGGIELQAGARSLGGDDQLYVRNHGSINHVHVPSSVSVATDNG